MREKIDATGSGYFYTASLPGVVTQLHAMIGDRREARDCGQEAFVKAWSRRHELDTAGSPPRRGSRA